MSSPRVAVVGGGLGGLTAAGLLAREGCEVTLFERSGALGGKAQSVEVEGLRLDTGPTLLTLPHLVRETFASLGAGDLLPAFHALDVQCDYRYPTGQRFRAFASVERSAEEAERLMAGEGAALRAFYEAAAGIYAFAGEPYLEAPFEGLPQFMGRVARRGLRAVRAGLQMGTLQQLADRTLRTPELRQFVGRFATYVGASPFQASAAFALIPHIERAFGCHHVAGGMGNLSRSLTSAVARLGVKFELNTRATWQAKGSGYLVGPPGAQAPFELVVVNEDPLRSQGRDQEPLSLSGYVLLLGVAERAALPHHSVLFSQNYAREFQKLFAGELPLDPTLYVNHPAATDASVAPPGQSGLFVMANAPPLPPRATGESEEAWLASAEEKWKVHAQALRSTILSRLESEFPSLRGKLRVLAERTPLDFERLGAPRGSLYGHLPHGKFGPFNRPRNRGDTPGLYFAGGGTHPGGGVPMVMLSGRFAAGLALADWRRRKRRAA